MFDGHLIRDSYRRKALAAWLPAKTLGQLPHAHVLDVSRFSSLSSGWLPMLPSSITSQS